MIQSRRCCYEVQKDSRCKANAQTGTDFCFFHDPSLGEERAAARRAGGIARTRKIVLPANLAVKRLQTVADVAELLGETINQVRRGELDLRVSNAVGYLSGILLSAIEKSSFEERLVALETAVATHRSQALSCRSSRMATLILSNRIRQIPYAQTKTTDKNRNISDPEAGCDAVASRRAPRQGIRRIRALADTAPGQCCTQTPSGETGGRCNSGGHEGTGTGSDQSGRSTGPNACGFSGSIGEPNQLGDS